MIISRLMGGLGNQMFQYSICRNLSITYNRPVKIDLSFLNRRDLGSNFIYREYDLDIFNIVEDFITSIDENIPVFNQPYFHFTNELKNNLNFFLKNNPKIILEGYWQSKQFFFENESQIKKDFTFKKDIKHEKGLISDLFNKIKSENSVMINVRRTDYLKNNFHGVIGLNYINKAKEIIESKITNPHYFIFSDDIDWCNENLKTENSTIVDHRFKGEKFSFYLQLMSSCRYYIIPNSTFAWWSVFLNNDIDKIVISPKKWFTDESINTKELIPNDWIRI